MNRTKFAILSILSSISLGVVIFGAPKDVAATFAYQNNDGATYYNSVDKYATGNALVTGLNSLNNQKRQRLIPYDNLTSYFTQTDPGKSSGQVTAFYSGTSARYSGNMNREHVWPYSKLYLNGDDRADEGQNEVEQDLHMVRPAMKDDNTGRGNNFFTMPDGQGWDPGSLGDETYRGDSARIIFYCAIADLNLSVVDKDYDSKYNHSMGKLSTLLKWNLQYPVKNREKTRNEAVESIQGHRNPFIDHPEYACRIWGNTNSETKKICGSYGIEGDISISNAKIVDDEITMEVNDNLTFAPSFTGSITPTYSWTFSTQAGTQQQTDVASMTSGSNNSISVKALKVGTTYLKLSATYTMTNGVSESLWKVVKINVVPNVEVVSIQITSFPNKISYIVGETFNSYGLVVSANYSDGSSKDVTNKVTLLNTNLDSEGTKTITVSYTYKEITVETSFSVFVRSSGGGGNTPPASSGGCGGNIATTSVILSSLSLVAAFLITVSIRKKKKK